MLKPGGRIFCSVPLFFQEHQAPYDFYRYTQYALRKLFADAGFEIVRIEWLEGYFGTVAYQFSHMYNHLPPDVASVRAMGTGLAHRLPGAADPRDPRRSRASCGVPFARADIRWKYTDDRHAQELRGRGPQAVAQLTRATASGHPDRRTPPRRARPIGRPAGSCRSR